MNRMLRGPLEPERPRLPNPPRLIQARTEVVQGSKVREEAHRRLDELFDMYEDGAALWLRAQVGWTTTHTGIDDQLTIQIHPRYA